MEKPLVPDWIQQIIGPLVVATVIGLVGDRYRLGNTIDDLAGTQLKHQIYIDALNSFRTQGERFTYEDGEKLKSDMTGLVGDCKAAATKIQSIEVDMAKLPPSRWQERILRLESQIHELRGSIRMKTERPKTSREGGPMTAENHGINPMGIAGDDRVPVQQTTPYDR